MVSGGQTHRLPSQFWMLWAGTVVNRLALLTPAFIVLYLSGQRLATGAALALVVGVHGVGSVSASLFGGIWADRVGPRRAIMVSQGCVFLIALLLMVTRYFWLIVVLVFLVGALSAVHRPASSAIVVALADADRRVRAYGLLYWAHNIGASLAPVAAGLLLTVKPVLLFVPTVVGSLSYLVIAYALPELAPLRFEKRRRIHGVLKDLLEPFSSPRVGSFVLLSFLLACVYMQKQGALPLHMHENGLPASRIGVIFAFSGVLVVVLQPFASFVAARTPRHWSFAAAAVLVGVGFGLNVVMTTLPGYIVAVAIWTVGEILQVPLAAAVMADYAPAGRTASFQGAYSFSWNMGLTVGAPLGQLILGSAGGTVLWTGSFLLCMTIALAHLLRVRRS